MKKVLWLASWYPNKADPYSGDFIKRMAEAVSLIQPVQVIFAGKQDKTDSPDNPGKSNLDNPSTGLKEYIIYYRSPKANRGFVSKLRSLYLYIRKHYEIIREFRKNEQLPDIVHVQVAMKAGLVALYLKWKYKIPYVVTEHWSGYYEQSRDSLFKKSFLEKYLTRRILKNAALLLPVSDHLGNQIRHYWAQVPFQKIPNVVNTRFFFPSEKESQDLFRFIHISTLLYPKNVEGIIRSFAELLKQDFRAELILVGPSNPLLSEFLKSISLFGDKIHLTGEVSYEQVGRELRKSSALIMFSFYENMPCAILEALCTGLPVISSDVGGIPEILRKENGILVPPGNENDLTEAMKKMMMQYSSFNKNQISREASEMYSYQTAGKKITGVYQSVLEDK